MRTYWYVDEAGKRRCYTDRWRWRWLFSVMLPLLPVGSIALAEAGGNRLLLWLPLAVIYLVIPGLDWLLGRDPVNPPEAVVSALEKDPFYQWLAWSIVPLLVGVMVGGTWYTMTVAHGIAERLPLVLSLGFVAALGINAGHELGHKRSPVDRCMALLALAVSGYGHFRIEHNLGHHAQVATPEDSASARMGESVYRFALREVPGGLERGWRLEAARLRRQGRSPISWRNEILQGWIVTLVLQGGLVAWLGWSTLPWLLLLDAWAWFQLTGVNYIEHYGLLRQRTAEGPYERCRPVHSWNSNHLVSNVLLFHLQRHSDHHAHAERSYQSLRHFDEAPQLPTGYMGMLLLSYLPAVYFRLMDRRLLQQAGGTLERLNLDPARRTRLERRYSGAASSPK